MNGTDCDPARGKPGAPPDATAGLSDAQIRSRLLRSALSNYATLLVRLAAGVWLTRILFMNLSRVEYGFWSLLWSIFGYALLLDLGFGVAMVKYASQSAIERDWEGLGRRLNTVLAISAAMGAAIALATLAAAPLLSALARFEGPASDLHRFQAVFLLFGVGTALVFPLGVFAEVLTGLGRIPLRNAILAASSLAQFALLAAIVRRHLGLEAMAVATFGVNLATNVAMAAAARRLIPGFRFGWRTLDRGMLRATLSFSLFAHAITLAGLVALRSDQIVIGALLGVALVAPYQVVWRLADMFRQLSIEALEAVGPVAAALFQSRDRSRLHRTVTDADRVVAATATLLYLPLVVYLHPLLLAWLDLDDPQAWQSGILLLSAAYLSAVFKGTASRVLLMCQRERVLAAATLAEAALNLGASVTLCLYTSLGIVGVALGTFAPALLLSVAVYLPLSCRFSSTPPRAWLDRTLRGPLIAALVALPVYAACRAFGPTGSLALLAVNALPGLAAFSAAFLRFGLRPDERAAVWQRLAGAWAPAR